MRAWTLIALVAGCVAVACAPEDDDIDPTGPTGEVPPADLDPLTLVWEREIHHRDGFGEGITPVPLDGGERIAFVHDGDSVTRLYHLDAATGTALDSFRIEGPDIDGGRLSSYLGHYSYGDDLLVGIDRTLVRFGLGDGAVRWTRRLERRGLGLLFEGRSFSAAPGGKGDRAGVQAVSHADGAADVLYWSDVEPAPTEFHELAGQSPFRNAAGDLCTITVESRADTHFDSTLFTDPWAELRAYNLDADTVIWGYDIRPPWLAGRWLPSGSPAIPYEDLVIKTAWDTVYAFHPRTGEVAWRYWVGDPAASQGHNRNGVRVMMEPRIDHAAGLAYFACVNYDVYCVDAATGREVWRAEGKGSSGMLALVGDGLLVVNSSSGDAYVYDAHTGARLAKMARRTSYGDIESPPYYDPATKRLYAYDGARAFCYQVNFEVPGP